MTPAIALMGLLLPVIPVPKERPGPGYQSSDILVAYIDSGRVFVHVVTRTNPEKRTWKPVISLRGALADDSKVTAVKPIQRPLVDGHKSRWKIGHDQYWYVTEFSLVPNTVSFADILRMPMTAIAGVDRDWAPKEEEGGDALLADAVLGNVRDPIFRIQQGLGGVKFRMFSQRVYMDFLPTSDNSAKVFINVCKVIYVWRMTTRWDSMWLNGRGRWEPTWNDEETITNAFDDGPFWVFECKGAYLFVREDGHIHVARTIKDGRRRMEPLWSDEKRTIAAMITDTKSKKTFAFTKARDPKAEPMEQFYFELADPIKPKPFDSKKLKLTTAPEPLHTALQHARFLVEEKEIEAK